MSAWTDLGLPLPNAKDYGYTQSSGFVRTPFASALPEQKQVRTFWNKSFSVSWDLTLPQLELAEKYILEYGYSWFELEMVSSQTPSSETVSIHTVRLTGDYKITPIGALYMRLTATMETAKSPIICEVATCDDSSFNQNGNC